jgi:hypothetical protein
VQARWGIVGPLSERRKEGAAAALRRYRRNGETQSLNQVVFDDFVLGEETQLRLELRAEEIDYDPRYGVFETVHTPYYDDLGGGALLVSTVEPRSYEFRAADWSCVLTVSVFEYPFGPTPSVSDRVLAGSPAPLLISPNPSASAVRIAVPGAALAIPSGPATLLVYDVSGRLVRRITGDLGGGFVWDGRDAEGRLVPAGVYVHRVATGERVLYGRSFILR